MLRTLWIILALMALKPLHAAHLVGGELSYECLGNNNYQIKLIIYRDCQSNGAPFDDPAIVTVYDGLNNVVDNLLIPLSTSRLLPVTAPSSCTSLPNFVCTSEGVYLTTINLPTNSTGYTLSHQRCCRNGSIDNVPNPNVWGNTYTIDIPPNVACNSSPSFIKSPPVALCLNIFSTIDMSVNEGDGDSLSYFLCEPLHGGGNQATSTGPNSPRPDTATPPPYQTVPFRNGFNAGAPLPGAPTFTLNQQTGILTGTPTQVGQYVFAICVQEWRNGQLLSTLRRDFQFNVTNACQGTASDFMPQTTDPLQLCQGTTVKFNELCFNANSYLWDFGVPNTTLDTSTAPNPTFTFPDTGVYTITLIANPGSSCSDTAQREFKIYNNLNIAFDIGGQACYDSHSLDFTPRGNFSDSAQFFWNFGGMTNRGPNGSTEKEPRSITYNQAGTYIVQLEVQDGDCSDIYRDTVELFDRPLLKHDLSAPSGCLPLAVNFTDSSEYQGGILQHRWDFGDGFTSSDASPEHVYQQPGTYFVSHEIRSVTGCIDTVFERSDQAIVVYPKPQAGFKVFPAETDIFNPDFNLVINEPDSNQITWIILPNGRRVDPRSLEFQYSASDTGSQEFIQIIENQYGCTDTLIVSTYVTQPFRLYVPNAFTPNGDQRNDYFSYSILGVSQFEIMIFNRWGEVVFSSSDPSDYWNGQIMNRDQKASGGVYTYQMKVSIMETGETYFKRGHVNLIR